VVRAGTSDVVQDSTGGIDPGPLQQPGTDGQAQRQTGGRRPVTGTPKVVGVARTPKVVSAAGTPKVVSFAGTPQVVSSAEGGDRRRAHAVRGERTVGGVHCQCFRAGAHRNQAIWPYGEQPGHRRVTRDSKIIKFGCSTGRHFRHNQRWMRADCGGDQRHAVHRICGGPDRQLVGVVRRGSRCSVGRSPPGIGHFAAKDTVWSRSATGARRGPGQTCENAGKNFSRAPVAAITGSPSR
jgi:hypothetical protein